jgi:hypothetical protein
MTKFVGLFASYGRMKIVVVASQKVNVKGYTAEIDMRRVFWSSGLAGLVSG